MNIPVLSFINESLLKAVCWTLIDSVWIGIIAALLATLIMAVTRKSGPHVRYNLLLITLVLAVAGVAFAFFAELLSRSSGNMGTAHVEDAPNTDPSFILGVIDTGGSIGPVQKLNSFFNEYAVYIVSGWLIIIMLKMLAVTKDLVNLRSLMRKKTVAAGADWDARITMLASRLHLHKPVRMLQSGLTKVPLVIGYLKPIILVPVGLCTSLPQQEVEAILIHELAHIKRNDYLVNIFQCFIEVLFFFNPAFLWISSLIRTERESCCDDIVVMHTQNKRQYIEALISFQQYNLQMPQVNTAFTGSKNHLLNRVRRMLFEGKIRSLNVFEKGLLICTFLLASAITFSFAQLQKTDKAKEKTVEKQAGAPYPVNQDPAKVSEGTTCMIEKMEGNSLVRIFYLKRKGVLYRIDRKNNTTAALAINGKQLNDAGLKQHTALINQLLNEYYGTTRSLNTGIKEDDKLHTQPDMVNADKELHKRPDVVEEDKALHRQPDKVKESKKQHKAANGIKEDEKLHQRPDVVKEDEEVKKFMDRVVEALIKENIITTKEGLSFKLDHHVLIVNGVKQAEPVRAKFNKFLSDPNSVLVYRFSE